MKSLVLLTLVFLAKSAFADSWSPPESRAYPSPNGRFILRVIPGHIVISDEAIKALGLPPNTEPARSTIAEVFELTAKGDRYQKIRAFPLLNAWSPVDACISDLAEVYTFDDWAMMGHRLVVVCYSSEGKPKKEFTLQELIPDSFRKEIEENHSSKSSIWWRKGGGQYGGPGPYFDFNHALVVEDALGGRVVFTSGPTVSVKYYPAEKVAN